MNEYPGLCVELYDLLHPSPSKEELKFYLGYAKKAGGAVLEPMCGSGRFLIPLMVHGLDVSGFDTSEVMLKACRRKARRQGLSPDLKKAGIERFRYDRKFTMIFIPAGSFCFLLEDAAVHRALKRLYDHLDQQGVLLLEIETTRIKVKSINKRQEARFDRQEGPGRFLTRMTADYDQQANIWRSSMEISVLIDGRAVQTEKAVFSLRLYDPMAFHGILKERGFKSIKIKKRYSYDEPAKSNEVVIFECRR